MRAYFGIVLAVLLALTGQSMAVARGTPNAAGAVVLCTGTGPVVVTVDDQGQPVGPPHICPDFAISMFNHVMLAPDLPDRPVTRGEKLRHGPGLRPDTAREIAASARGPPRAG